MGRILDLLERIGDDGASSRRLHGKARSIHDHLERAIALEDAVSMDSPLITHDQDGKHFLTSAGIAIRANGMEPNPKRLGMPKRPLPSHWIGQHTKAGHVVPEHLLESQRDMLGLQREGISVSPVESEEPSWCSDRIKTPNASFVLDRRLRRRGDQWTLCLRARDGKQSGGPDVLLPEYLAIAALLAKADLDRLEEHAGDDVVIGVLVESGSTFGDALATTIEKRLSCDLVRMQRDDPHDGFETAGDDIPTPKTFG